MKKLIALLVTAFMLISMCFGMTACKKPSGDVGEIADVKAAGVLVVGITDYEPMDYKEPGSNKWIGFDAEMATLFAQRLGVEIEFFEIADWNAKVAELNTKQFDLIWNGMTASADLEDEIDLSLAYAKNAQVLVVKNGTNIANKEAVKALNIAVENGSAGDKTATAEGVTNINRVPKQVDALLEVISGNSDAAMIDLTMAESVLGKGTYVGLSIVDGITYGAEVFAVGARTGSNLIPELNKFFKEKYADGTMQALLEKYAVSLNTSALQ